MQIFVLTPDAFCKIYFISLLLWKTTGTSYRLPKFCQHAKKSKECEFKSNPERVICRRNLNYFKDYTTAKVVFSCSWSLDYINPEEILSNFQVAQKLTIQNGNVTEFLTDFPKSKYLQTLTLVNLNLKELRKSLFALLENLKFLDLSHNRLKYFPPEIIKAHSSLSKVILIDNPWNCSLDLKWILDKSINSKLANKNLVQCGGNIYPGKPVYSVMSLIKFPILCFLPGLSLSERRERSGGEEYKTVILSLRFMNHIFCLLPRRRLRLNFYILENFNPKKVEKDCPTHICSCTMNNIVWNTEQTYLIPVITVDCTERGLTELPEKLPVNTTSLILSKNNISNLLPIIQNKFYRNVADIYLDYNQVTSIDVLEGAFWLKTFRVLSLKGNQLSQLPIYALDNAFEKNTNMAKVYLGNNPWKCDCLFIPEFQHLLIKYSSIIKDKSDIKCSEEKDNENSNRQIGLLSTKSVCRKPVNGINPLDALSAVFAFLIFIIVGKLVYDYWTFKKTGKLPWIVTKMP